MSIVTSLWRWLADMLRRHFASRKNVVVPPVVVPPITDITPALLLLLLEEI
jgi:hypothetical protein